MRKTLCRAMDEARKITHQDRSWFIRTAMAREIRRLGIAIPPGIEDPPSRAKPIPPA
jgi:hypothetical protein